MMDLGRIGGAFVIVAVLFLEYVPFTLLSLAWSLFWTYQVWRGLIGVTALNLVESIQRRRRAKQFRQKYGISV